MIDTVHYSILQVILPELGPADCVRLASCSKSLYESIMISACHATLIPILRERLKDACWSLLQAGYTINVKNTLARWISRDYKETLQMHYADDVCMSYNFAVAVNDRKTFSDAFDKYIIHPDARLQRSSTTGVRIKRLEKHFARCSEQLQQVATAGTCSCSMC